MRRFLAVAVIFQCARLITAATVPLTGNDILLMLRMGYSSEDIVRDLRTKRFAGPLDSTSEAQIRQAAPKLADDLKSGQFDATVDQLTQAQQKTAAINAAAEEFARQQRIVADAVTAQQRIASQNTEVSQARRATTQIIDLETGQGRDLRQFGGPNMTVVVQSVETDVVKLTLFDYAHMQPVANTSNGYAWIGWAPTTIPKQIEKVNNSLIYQWGGSKLVYIDAMDVGLNHVRLGVVTE
jgi:hypothetical protein